MSTVSRQDVALELDWPLKFAGVTFMLGASLGFLGGYKVCPSEVLYDGGRVWLYA